MNIKNMKVRYLFIVFGFLVFFACNKDKKANPGSNNGGEDTSQTQPPNLNPVSIEEALFTDPGKLRIKSHSTIIMDTLIHYLNCTPKGAVVHLSVYLFYYQPVIDAVSSAYNRGVEMHIMIDSSNGKSMDKNTLTFFDFRYRNKFQSPSEVIAINNQITPTAINHEKYVLFSEIDLPQGVAKHVVFSTSHNFIKSGMTRVQDAIIMTNEALYEAFRNHWDVVAAHADKDMKNYKYTVNNVGDSITAFFFPRRKAGEWDGNRTVIEILDKLDKSGYADDTVRVLISGWSGGPGIKIAEKLVTLQTEKVMVEVITGTSASETVKSRLNELKNAGGNVRFLDANDEIQVHSKTTLIKGKWEGEIQQIIYTGSQNYHKGALLYSNNQQLMLKNSILFSDYWKNFDEYKIN